MDKYHDVGVFWRVGLINFLFGAVVITEWETWGEDKMLQCLCVVWGAGDFGWGVLTLGSVELFSCKSVGRIWVERLKFYMQLQLILPLNQIIPVFLKFCSSIEFRDIGEMLCWKKKNLGTKPQFIQVIFS